MELAVVEKAVLDADEFVDPVYQDYVFRKEGDNGTEEAALVKYIGNAERLEIPETVAGLTIRR